MLTSIPTIILINFSSAAFALACLVVDFLIVFDSGNVPIQKEKVELVNVIFFLELVIDFSN